jgi:hypothetical protein
VKIEKHPMESEFSLTADELLAAVQAYKARGWRPDTLTFALDPVTWIALSSVTLLALQTYVKIEYDQKKGWRRGEEFRRWNVWLFSGNNARWLEPHKSELVRIIREARDRAGYEAAPDEIVFH